jgi:hypothetical protein
VAVFAAGWVKFKCKFAPPGWKLFRKINGSFYVPHFCEVIYMQMVGVQAQKTEGRHHNEDIRVSCRFMCEMGALMRNKEI